MIVTAGDGVQIVDDVCAVNAQSADALDACQPVFITGAQHIDFLLFLFIGELAPEKVGIFDVVEIVGPVLAREQNHIGAVHLLFQLIGELCRESHKRKVEGFLGGHAHLGSFHGFM